MLKTNRCWDMMTVLIQREVLSCRLADFGSPHSIHCIWAKVSLLSIVHWSSRIHNKHAILYVSDVFTAYFLAKFRATLLTQSACREVSSGVSSSKPGAQVHPENFRCVPPKRSIAKFSTFHSMEFIGSESWDAQPWTFVFFQKSNWSLSTFFSTSRRVSSYHQHVDIGNDSHQCICFQTCDHDTRDDVDNQMSIFFILPAIDKEFWTFVAWLAFKLFKLFRQSVSLSVLMSMLALGEILLRLSTSAHVVVTVSRGMRVLKLHASLIEQDSIVFRWKHSSVFRSVLDFFALFVLSRLYTNFVDQMSNIVAPFQFCCHHQI